MTDSTDYGTISVPLADRRIAEMAKRDSETWGEYIRRCADSMTVEVELHGPEQIATFLRARELMAAECDDDVSDADVFREALTEWLIQESDGQDVHTQLVSETAIENGDSVFPRGELKALDPTVRRNLAADADTDAINGKSTIYEVAGYHSPDPLIPLDDDTRDRDPEASDG